MLVREWWKRNGRKASTLQPVNSGGVDGDSFLSRDIWTILQIVVLPLLLCLEIEPRQPAKVLLTHCLVHRSSSTDSLPVVVSRVCPPVGFGLDVAEDHVLDGDGKARDLPRDVGLPAAPGLTEVLEDCPCFILLDSLGHHVKNIMHYLGKREREGEGRKREGERMRERE